jgi:hypothetical protein
LVIKALDPDWIRIRVRIDLQPQPLDPDPDPEKMNTDPKHWLEQRPTSVADDREILIKFRLSFMRIWNLKKNVYPTANNHFSAKIFRSPIGPNIML